MAQGSHEPEPQAGTTQHDRWLASELCSRELERWWGQLRPLRDEWDKNWKYWMITTPLDQDNSFLSKEQVPYCYSAVETVTPRIVGNDPKMTYRPTENPNDELSAALLGGVATYQMERMGFEMESRHVVRQALITGISPAKVGWVREYQMQTQTQTETHMQQIGDGLVPLDVERESQTRVVTRNEPFMECVDCYDFVFPLTSKSLDDAPAVWQRVWWPLQHLERYQEQGIYRNIDQIEAADSTKWQEAHNQRLSFQQLSPQFGSLDDIDSLVEVWERWTDDRLVVIANRNIVIRDDPNPFDHKKKPFALFTPTPWPFQMYGMSMVKSLRDLNESLNTLRRQRRDAVTYGNNPMFKATGIDQDEIVMRPGGVIDVTDTEDIEPLNMPSTDWIQASLEEEQSILADMERTSGAFDYFGGSSGGAGRSATGFSILTQERDKLVQEKVKVFDEQFMHRLGWLLMKMNLQYLTGDTVVNFTRSPGAVAAWQRATGMEPPESGLVSVPTGQAKPDGALEPVPSVGTDQQMIDALRRSDATQLAQTLLPMLPVAPPVCNWQALTKYLLEAFEVPDADIADITTMPPPPPGLPVGSPVIPPTQNGGPSGDNKPTGVTGAPGASGPIGPPLGANGTR